MKVLAGDIGGTKARFGLFEVDDTRVVKLVEETYPSASAASLGEVAERFVVRTGETIERACFGVPGPVQDGRARITNLPWLVDAAQLAEVLDIDSVVVINDLAAAAYGIDRLTSDDLVTLSAGDGEPNGNAAIVAAGTGLGQAGLFWDGTSHLPFSTEGGHVGFAPHDELEIALQRFLAQRFGHVSWERMVSGPGLVNLYEFLRDYRNSTTPDWLAAAMAADDPAKAISEAGMAARCSICSETLDVFVRLYGSVAGNVALQLMATGGIYIGGGIAPKLLERFTSGAFVDAFVDKGRMRGLLRQVPVHVVVNDRLPLIGAAWRAICAPARD